MKAVTKKLNLGPYEPRPIRFLEVWRHGDWKLKVYGIAHGRATPCPALIAAAKRVVADRLDSVPQSIPHYSVGFLGIHDGRTSNFVFVDWWADENELHHHVYVSPKDEPQRLNYATPTGAIACVWDLRVLAFERQSWLDTVLKPAGNVNLDAYLEQQLNEDT
jgi:hypothetical protein